MPKIPTFRFPRPGKQIGGTDTKKPLIIGGVALLTFLVVGFLFWWFYPKASVVVYVSPKKLNEDMELTLGDNISSSEESVEVSGDKTKSTTGVKVVGEKAKGSVKIQNGTSNNINLDAGTKISSSTGLEFVLEDSASISAALSPSSPGTATVNVEAGDIGSEYNLAKDETFKVGNYPKADVDAVSTDDFSGGSSREISAVSEDDMTNLEDSLEQELLDQAKEKLNNKIDSDHLLIDSSLKSEKTSVDFSNKEGDEASTLKLSLSLKVTGTVVPKKDLTEASNKLLEGKIPQGFVLRDDQISYKFESSGKEGDKFNVNVSVNLLPGIDTKEVAKVVAGKLPEVAREHISSIPGFVRAEFKLTPLFPGKLGTLPHVVKRIGVEVSAEK